MAKKRRKKKYKKKNIILVSIAIIAILILLYFYFPLFLGLFKNTETERKNLETYKIDLAEYSVFGIDISYYQNKINWDTLVSKNKIDFVFIRATAGIDNFDKHFLNNWERVKHTRIIRGAYHYYRPDENSTEQADFFIKNVKLEEGDMPPVLDIERYSNIQSLKRLKSGLINWLNIVEEYYQITPIIYTCYQFYMNVLYNDPRFEKYPVWIALYNTDERPDLIKKEWVFWQFTDKGAIYGINGDVDINVFNGRLKDMDGLRISEKVLISSDSQGQNKLDL
jgi:lysozyme